MADDDLAELDPELAAKVAAELASLDGSDAPELNAAGLMNATAGAVAKPVPVVLLHGAGQLPTMWQEQAEALGAKRRMLAPWVAGLRPGANSAPVSLDGAANELAQTLQLNGIVKADLVGHQLGAMVALELAFRHPELVNRLVLSGVMLLPGKFALAVQKAAIKMLPASRLAESGITKDDLIASLDAMASADFASHLDEITVPTLVICSAHDSAGLPFAEMLASGLADAKLVILPGASPHPMLDTPEEYNRSLLDFLTV